jgi:hypothetical protein
MSVKTEMSLMMEPIWQWGSSVDRQALIWWLLVDVVVIVFAKTACTLDFGDHSSTAEQ